MITDCEPSFFMFYQRFHRLTGSKLWFLFNCFISLDNRKKSEWNRYKARMKFEDNQILIKRSLFISRCFSFIASREICSVWFRSSPLIAYGLIITKNFARFSNICESRMICFWFDSTSCFLSTLALAFPIHLHICSTNSVKKRPRLTHMNHMICSFSVSREQQKKKKTRETSCRFITNQQTIIHPTFGSRWHYALKQRTRWFLKGFCFELNAARHAAMRKPDINWQLKFSLPQWLKMEPARHTLECTLILVLCKSQEQIH